VGSLQEEEHERGLAHFVEHMGFKGTRSFEQGDLVKFLESIGASFGADLNAHTSMEETVYKLAIPTETLSSRKKLGTKTSGPSLLEQGLHIMSEWASGMRISEEDVSSEQAIIEEEWRSRQGVSQRLLERYWGKIFGEGQSQRYATRMPIGLREVFMNCTAAQVRSFYHKWYRPELMSVVIVGDIPESPMPGADGNSPSDGLDAVVQMVRNFFGGMGPTPVTYPAPCAFIPSIPSSLADNTANTAPAEKVEQADWESGGSGGSGGWPALKKFPLPRHFGGQQRQQHQQRQQLMGGVGYDQTAEAGAAAAAAACTALPVCVSMRDPELTSSSVSIEFFSPLQPSPSVAFIREEMIRRLLTSLVDRRLTLIARKRVRVPAHNAAVSGADEEAGAESEPPFLTAGVSSSAVVPGLLRTTLSAQIAGGGVRANSSADVESADTAKAEAVRTAVFALILEWERIHVYGFR
jgi:hypothetical protein